MARKKKEKYQPSKRTIQVAVKVITIKNAWPVFQPYRFYYLRKKFRIKALRGAMVQPIRPAGVNPVSCKYEVKLVHFSPRNGWEEGDTLIVKASEMIDKIYGDDD